MTHQFPPGLATKNRVQLLLASKVHNHEKMRNCIAMSRIEFNDAHAPSTRWLRGREWRSIVEQGQGLSMKVQLGTQPRTICKGCLSIYRSSCLSQIPNRCKVLHLVHAQQGQCDQVRPSTSISVLKKFQTTLYTSRNVNDGQNSSLLK